MLKWKKNIKNSLLSGLTWQECYLRIGTQWYNNIKELCEKKNDALNTMVNILMKRKTSITYMRRLAKLINNMQRYNYRKERMSRYPRVNEISSNEICSNYVHESKTMGYWHILSTIGDTNLNESKQTHIATFWNWNKGRFYNDK